MKKNLFATLFLCFFICPLISAQMQKASSIWVNDTRDVNEPPSAFQQEVRADLKFLSTTGISTAYGFSTNLTISPWADGSAGYTHQLSFNNNGIFYRNGDYSSLWNGWKKLLISDLSGNVEVGNKEDNAYSEFVIHGPNSPAGEASRRDILFKFHNAGQSGIRAYRGNEWGTFLQLMTSQNGVEGGRPQVRMHLDGFGKVGINTVQPQSELDVNGTIRAKEIKVESFTTDNPQNEININAVIQANGIKVKSDWADFVFKKEYNLLTLEEVEQHIVAKGTLPGIPSEEEVKANGVDLAKTNALLLQKIEELTLYIIQMKKEIDALKQGTVK